jgi:hypothetical protein
MKMTVPGGAPQAGENVLRVDTVGIVGTSFWLQSVLSYKAFLVVTCQRMAAGCMIRVSCREN